jgi:hypothetical protein
MLQYGGNSVWTRPWVESTLELGTPRTSERVENILYYVAMYHDRSCVPWCTNNQCRTLALKTDPRHCWAHQCFCRLAGDASTSLPATSRNRLPTAAGPNTTRLKFVFHEKNMWVKATDQMLDEKQSHPQKFKVRVSNQGQPLWNFTASFLLHRHPTRIERLNPYSYY